MHIVDWIEIGAGIGAELKYPWEERGKWKRIDVGIMDVG